MQFEFWRGSVERAWSLQGLTTARPFTSPVSLGHLAGRIFSPHRQTPMHQRHQEAGAKLMQAGNWLRPEYYVCQGSTRQQDDLGRGGSSSPEGWID